MLPWAIILDVACFNSYLIDSDYFPDFFIDFLKKIKIEVF